MSKNNEEKKIKKPTTGKIQKGKKSDFKNKNLESKSSDLENTIPRAALQSKISSILKKKESVGKNGSARDLLKRKSSDKPKKESSALSDKEQSALNEKLKQAVNDNLYLRAEFENFKKRSAKEKSQLIRYSGEQLISTLADEVLDDLDRAIHSAEKEGSFENLKRGLDMIHKKLLQVLNRFGVEILDPTGEVFDPSHQEALSYIKTSQTPEGHVAKTFKKAYKLHDRVIRPAKVVLAKKEEKD